MVKSGLAVGQRSTQDEAGEGQRGATRGRHGTARARLPVARGKGRASGWGGRHARRVHRRRGCARGCAAWLQQGGLTADA